MMNIPSLLGDGKGNYRVHVVGNSGTGKSTVSTYIATKLNVPHISLDALFWGPGWTTPSDDEYKERIIGAMAQDPRGWVIDGNHRGTVTTVITEHATDVIWLDPPLWLYLPRILWRTLLRLLNIIPSCAEGCEETWGDVLSTNGIIWYCISQHGYRKQQYDEMLARTSIAKGGKMRRLNEWDGDLTIWKAGFEEMLRAH
ncbi:hypothetical protein BDR06DRAFT_580269 [Suillus hirtellus]|nr:hypothetical protein BDR06DRAFT_580269 [Suillus hirtellus]